MNGNFEVNKAAYPFGPVHFEAGVKLHHMPTMQRLLNVALPDELAARAQMRLNSAYYAQRAGGAKFTSDLQTVKDIVSQELTTCVQDGLILGPSATQLQRWIDEAVA